MGLKTAIEWVRERIYPAKVAPFVTMIAEALAATPGDFEVQRLGTTLSLKVREGASDRIESDLVIHGVGIDIDLACQDMVLTTFYFDDVQLNWREKRLLMEAVCVVVEAYEDAEIIALDTGFEVIR